MRGLYLTWKLQKKKKTGKLVTLCCMSLVRNLGCAQNLCTFPCMTQVRVWNVFVCLFGFGLIGPRDRCYACRFIVAVTICGYVCAGSQVCFTNFMQRCFAQVKLLFAMLQCERVSMRNVTIRSCHCLCSLSPSSWLMSLQRIFVPAFSVSSTCRDFW